MRDKVKSCMYQRKYRKENYERCRASNFRWETDNPHAVWADGSLRNHRKNGFITKITASQLKKRAKQTEKCPICAIELKRARGRLCGASPSLSRKTRSKVLTQKNTWITCYKCNAMQQNLSWIEYVQYCRNISMIDTIRG